MAERIGATPVRYPFSFVVAGDSGAWPDPTADGIFGQLVRQTAQLDPAPVFFANLGDFAGPGTRERHEHYLRLVEPLPIPDLCVVGNHDLDDERSRAAWRVVHGPTNYSFAYGHTRFVVIDGAPGKVGASEVGTPTSGPRAAALALLEETLAAAAEPHRVVFTHAPPHLGGHLEPHPEWGFSENEEEFLDILSRHRVGLVCCAHGLAFDHHVHDGVRFVISGGGGTALCSHLRGVCTPGRGRPEDRGALFHAVQIVVGETGSISGRVLQAFDPVPGHARIIFGDDLPGP